MNTRMRCIVANGVAAAAWLACGFPPLVAAPAENPASGNLSGAQFVLPAEQWHLEVLAASHQYDPQRIASYVHDHIGWIPYSGVLRGADATLWNRSGNALDRSLLLAELLRESGYEVRFVRSNLDQQEARRRVLAAIASARRDPFAHSSLREFATLRRLAGSDAPSILDPLAESERIGRLIAGRFEERPLDERSLAALNELQQAVEEARDHWWVQMRSAEGRWIDLETDPAGADRLPSILETHDEIPEESYQLAVIRLVLETRSEAGLGADTLIEVAAPVFQLLAEGTVLLHVQSSHGGGGGLLGGLAARKLVPMLCVGDVIYEGKAFEYHQRAADGGSPRLGGLGGTSFFGGDKPDTIAQRLEIALRVPGRDEQVVTRTLFDRLGPAARRSERRAAASLRKIDMVADLPLSLRQAHHIGFSSGMLDAEAFAQCVLNDTLGSPANAQAEALAERPAAVEPPAEASSPPEDGGLVSISRLPDSIHQAIWTTRMVGNTVGLLLQAQLAQQNRAAGVLLYEPVPRIGITSFWSALLPDGTVALDVSVDLIRSGVRAIAGEDVPRTSLLAQKVRYGVGQGCVEHLAVAMLLEGHELSPGDIESMPAVAMQATGGGIGWQVLSDASLVDSYPPDAAALLAEHLSAGHWAVVPSRPTILADREVLHWWQFDPHTGDVAAVADSTLHMARHRWPGGRGKKFNTRERAKNAAMNAHNGPVYDEGQRGPKGQPRPGSRHSTHGPKQYRHMHNEGNFHYAHGKQRGARPPGHRVRTKFRQKNKGGNEYMLVVGLTTELVMASTDVYPEIVHEGVVTVADNVLGKLVQ